MAALSQFRAASAAFEDVLAAARHGEGWAFEQLWKQLSPAVAGYLRTQGGREPEDLTSEVFLGAYRGLSSFSGNEEQFRSWLFTIAHRRLTDERRRAGRRPAPDPLDDADNARGPATAATVSASDVEGEVARRLADDRVREVCGRLVADQRDVLLLRLVAGLTVVEIAEILGKSPGAVKALQRRGIAAIERMLGAEGVPL